MKWINKYTLFVLSVSILLAGVSFVQKAKAQDINPVYVSYNDFYQDLASYGQWIEDPKYGYVWSPNVDGDFRPYYTNGYWVMTEYGNTWVSLYPWGWACFHYGRWTYDNYYGWLWIPGSTWGPAWVCWRHGDGFYGWAALGPDYEIGTEYSCPNNWWVFIPPQYIYSGNYYHYWNGPHGNSEIIKNTLVVNNTYSNNGVTYITGPRTKEVEDAGHQPVQVYHLANSKSLTSTVHNNIVKMYHPFEIKPAAVIDGQRATPPNVVSAPQPVKSQQSLKEGAPATPAFRDNLPKNIGHEETPGANINQTAKPAPPQPSYEKPYEYDINRPVPQPRQDPPSSPQPTATRPKPAQPQPQQNTNRPAQPAPQNTHALPPPARTEGSPEKK